MANYPIPPWLQVSPGDFGSAAAKGAEISLGRERIQQEAQAANMRAAEAASALAARREAEQQNAQREAVQLEYQHAYQQAEIGLKQQQQEQAEQEFQMSVKSAAQKSQAQLEAQRRIQAGEDPTKVYMELGPMLGITGAGMATLARKPPELGKVTQITLSGGRTADAVRTGANQIRLVMPPPAAQTNIQSVPVMSPSGEEIPGVVGIPGPTGFRPHNLPRETAGASFQKKLEARKAALGKTSTGTSKPEKIPQAAIDHLKKFPDTADAFDKKYGEGEADKILGKVSPVTYRD